MSVICCLLFDFKFAFVCNSCFSWINTHRLLDLFFSKRKVQHIICALELGSLDRTVGGESLLFDKKSMF